MREEILRKAFNDAKAVDGQEKEAKMALDRAILLKMEEKKALGAARLAQASSKRERLAGDLLSVGLWRTVQEMEHGLSHKSKTAAISLLTTQIRARQILFEQPEPNPGIYKLTRNGAKLEYSDLKETRKILINSACSNAEKEVEYYRKLVGKTVLVTTWSEEEECEFTEIHTISQVFCLLIDKEKEIC